VLTTGLKAKYESFPYQFFVSTMNIINYHLFNAMHPKDLHTSCISVRTVSRGDLVGIPQGDP